MSCFIFDLLQCLYIPWIQDNRLLADCIGTVAKRKPDMGVMKIIGRADADEVNAILFRPAPKFIKVPIEPLDFRKESDVERILIEYSH